MVTIPHQPPLSERGPEKIAGQYILFINVLINLFLCLFVCLFLFSFVFLVGRSVGYLFVLFVKTKYPFVINITVTRKLLLDCMSDCKKELIKIIIFICLYMGIMFISPIYIIHFTKCIWLRNSLLQSWVNLFISQDLVLRYCTTVMWLVWFLLFYCMVFPCLQVVLSYTFYFYVRGVYWRNKYCTCTSNSDEGRSE